MSEPVSDKYRAEMNAIAQTLDELFNGDALGKDRKIAFMLLVAEFDKMDGGRVNYIANGARADCRTMLKELLARWEGQPEQVGTA
jgi:hypothetical protein